MISIRYRFGFDPGYSSCDLTICLVNFWVGVNPRRKLFCLIRKHGILTISDTILDPIPVPSLHKNRWNKIKSVSNGLTQTVILPQDYRSNVFTKPVHQMFFSWILLWEPISPYLVYIPGIQDRPTKIDFKA